MGWHHNMVTLPQVDLLGKKNLLLTQIRWSLILQKMMSNLIGILT